MPSKQTMMLGDYEADINSALQRLDKERYVQRLWQKDASLWSDDNAVRTSIRNRLGWLNIPSVMARQTQSLRDFAQEARSSGFSHALLLGMGGSGLFSEVCRNTFGWAKNFLELTVLDTTDPVAISAQQSRFPLKQLLVIVSSKSGSTSEVSALSKYFYELFKSLGGRAGDHCIAITDEGTPLERLAREQGFRSVFVHGPDNGADVGGRFSALTYFGLVPSSLMGVDLDLLLSRSIQMREQCAPDVPARKNPAAELGAALGLLALTGKDKLTLLSSGALGSFATWLEQLVAESTGKAGKGIVPLFGEPMRDPSGYQNDRVFIELQLADEIDKALRKRALALSRAGHPVIQIQWQDRYDLGEEVIRWFMATTLASSVLGINPFDEPNVQESKDRTRLLLEQYSRSGHFSDAPVIFSDGEINVSGKLSINKSDSLSHILAAFLKQASLNDYVAILSFLPRQSILDAAAADIRSRISDGSGLATMLGFGPRYLHSTGQLFKGGSDRGLFLLLTSDDPLDLKIPGESFTFGILKQAQALGDFQAMQEKGRRVLRIHISGKSESGAKRLIRAIDEALASGLHFEASRKRC